MMSVYPSRNPRPERLFFRNVFVIFSSDVTFRAIIAPYMRYLKKKRICENLI